MKRLAALLTALCALLWAQTAVAATASLIGTAATTTGATTIAISSTTADCPVNNYIVVLWSVTVSTGSITSVTDNASTPNTYSVKTVITQAGDLGTSVQAAFAKVTTDLPIHSTITATAAGTTSNMNLGALCISGIVGSSAEDTSAAASATGLGSTSAFTATVTSNALAQADEMLVCYAGTDNNGTSPSSISGWTFDANVLSNGVFNALTFGHVETAATTAKTCSINYGAGSHGAWAIGILALKVSGGAVVTPRGTLLGILP